MLMIWGGGGGDCTMDLVACPPGRLDPLKSLLAHFQILCCVVLCLH